MAVGSGRDATELHRLTGGNPFFLTEVLASRDEAIPPTVGDAILARAARLSPEARRVLDMAAVIGTKIDTNLLQAIAGPVFDEIEECLAGGLLRATETGLTFRHTLVRDAIHASIAPPRRPRCCTRACSLSWVTIPKQARNWRGSSTMPKLPATRRLFSGSPPRPVTMPCRCTPTVRRQRTTPAP